MLFLHWAENKRFLINYWCCNWKWQIHVKLHLSGIFLNTPWITAVTQLLHDHTCNMHSGVCSCLLVYWNNTKRSFCVCVGVCGWLYLHLVSVHLGQPGNSFTCKVKCFLLSSSQQPVSSKGGVWVQRWNLATPLRVSSHFDGNHQIVDEALPWFGGLPVSTCLNSPAFPVTQDIGKMPFFRVILQISSLETLSIWKSEKMLLN